MADTARSLTALKALFTVGNTTGAIGAQDVRDIIETLTLSYGEMYVADGDGATTTISAADTFTVDASTYTLGEARGFDMNSNGQLRYTGTPDVEVRVDVTTSMTASSNNKVAAIRIAKNSSDLPASGARRKINTGTDVEAMATQVLVPMSTNDYLTLEIANETDDTDLAVSRANMIAVAFAV